MAKEKNLTNVTSLAAADFVRVVTSAGASVKGTMENFAKSLLTTAFSGLSLGGSQQSVKDALDSLNSKTYSTLTVYDERVEDYMPAEADSSRVVTCGNVATVYFNVVYLKAVTSSQTSIFSLPSGIKPKYNTYSACVNRTSGKVYPLQISSTGNVNVMSGGQVAIGDQVVGQATFVID